MFKKPIFTIFFLFYTLSGYSWGEQGHLITGDIALIVVKKAVKDSVNKYVDGMKWGEAATWMDVVRTDPSYDYMQKWHYINVEKDSTYKKSEEENVVSEIEMAIAKLKNRSKLSKQEIAVNIKILFHLIGDMHQPLHVGYAVDKGGNTIDIDFLGRGSNLHKVWDTEIIAEKKITTAGLGELYAKITKEEFKKLNTIDVEAWMKESRAFLPQVYNFKKDMITHDYVDKNAEIIKKQLLYSGIRIAAVLNYVFSK